jgi:hypothetical protein
MGLVKLGFISTKDHSSLHQNGPDITWVLFFFLKKKRNYYLIEICILAPISL